MPSCVVPKCTNRSKDLQYHRFPKDSALSQRWVINIRRLDPSTTGKTACKDRLWSPTPSSRICSAHFSDCSYSMVRGRKILISYSVPTIFGFDKKVLVARKSPVKRHTLPATVTHTDPDPVTVTDHNYLGEQLSEQVPPSDAPTPVTIDIAQLKRENERLRKSLERQLSRNDRMMQQMKMFNTDQLEAMERRSTRGMKWSEPTVQRALQLKLRCGSGYQALLDQGLPYPSERTLARSCQHSYSSTQERVMAFTVEAYCAPVWARSLKYVPSSIVKLTSLPTPITEWKLPGAPSNFQVLLKRDDFTGSTMTGNKVRKLEFILADALQKGCRHIITTGDSHSNHCRAVAAACAVVGLQSHLLLRTDATDLAEVKYDGNLLLDRLFGAQIYFTPKEVNYKTYTEPRMQQIAQKILEETGEKSQLVCIGGSNAIGVWGYIQCFEEIRKQGIEFDDIVCVCGSSGTITGLAVANYLCGQPYRCHGILVCGTNKSLHGEIKESLDELGLTDVQSEEIVTLYEDYKYPAYGVNLPEQLEFIVEAATKTGILLDNTYTGKAAYGLSQLLQTRPEVFKGRKILFIHSGDTLSVQTESMASALLPLSTKSRVKFISETLGSD